MNGAEHHGDAGVSLVSETGGHIEAPVLPLNEVQKLAADRRAVAEDLLAEARDFEAQVAAFVSIADAAYAGERDAAEHARLTRENFAAVAAMRDRATRRDEELRRAEDAAKAELDTAQEHLQQASGAYEAAVAARSAQLPATADAAAGEAAAQAEVDAVLRLLNERREARLRADAQVQAMREHIGRIAGTTGLSTEAFRRVVERRVADALRHGAERGVP